MQDIIRNGLPLHWFTRRNALLTGLGIALTFVACNEAYHYVRKRVSEPAQAAPCFEPYDATYKPGSAPLPARGTPSTDQRGDELYLTRVKDAERLCTPQSCDKAALAAYNGALFWYFSDRMRHMRRLDMNYGEAGIARARQLYRTADDLAIEQGLRERYQAKTFRINDSRQHREVKSILIFKGGEAMRPCRKGDAG
jgi:hypothetical protein